MISCHISDPAGLLKKHHDTVHTIANNSISVVQQSLPIDNVEVVVYVNPRSTIPEVGVAGISPCGELALIAVDPANPKFEECLQDELRGTIAHELHHCARWRGVGFGETLFEVLITEGLARDFERLIRGDRLPSYQPSFHEEMPALWGMAKLESDSREFSYAEWFFGSEKRQIPRFAGYALGLWLVDRYKAHEGLGVDVLSNLEANRFRLPELGL